MGATPLQNVFLIFHTCDLHDEEIGIIFELLKEKIWKGKAVLKLQRLTAVLKENYGEFVDNQFYQVFQYFIPQLFPVRV